MSSQGPCPGSFCNNSLGHWMHSQSKQKGHFCNWIKLKFGLTANFPGLLLFEKGWKRDRAPAESIPRVRNHLSEGHIVTLFLGSRDKQKLRKCYYILLELTINIWNNTVWKIIQIPGQLLGHNVIMMHHFLFLHEWILGIMKYGIYFQVLFFDLDLM